MGFSEAVKAGFSKYVSFSGRAPRSEYWYWVLFIFLGNIACSFIDGIILGATVEDPAITGSIFGLATLLPSLAVTARRLHDVNRSGWWQLAPYGMLMVAGFTAALNAMILLWAAGIAALVLLVALLVWLVRAGTMGANDFGADPLGGTGGAPESGSYHRSRVPRAGRDD